MFIIVGYKISVFTASFNHKIGTCGLLTPEYLAFRPFLERYSEEVFP